MHARSVLASLTVFLTLVLSGSLMSVPLDEFPVAEGPPQFGEQPWIQGTLVVWKRYGGDSWEPMIQCRDIARLDNPVIDVAYYPAYQIGVILSPSHLFRGSGNGFPEGSPVYAMRLKDLARGRAADVLVSEFGRVLAASERHVFLKADHAEQLPAEKKRKILAKSVDRLGDLSADAFGVVAELLDDRENGGLSRMDGASEAFFVWQDRDPSVPGDSWKIHVKRTEDLFTLGTEHLVIDTKVRRQSLVQTLGVYLHLHENRLVYQGAEGNSAAYPIGIYIANLETGETTLVVTPGEETLFLKWPAVSAEYVVWTEHRDSLHRTPYARRLDDWLPVGEPFAISTQARAGSWLMLSGNIAVWNGLSIDEESGHDISLAIHASELPLPGADDVGDVDQDGRLGVTDPVVILNYLFRGGWRPRLRLADADGDGRMQLNDAVVILRYLFQGGPRPGG